MADKAARLVLDALSRAAAEPAGLPLFARRDEPGFFPATALGKSAAQNCLDEGFLKVLNPEADTCAISEKGLEYLLQKTSPKQVLEDFVRILERRRGEVDAMAAQLDRLRGSIEGMHATLRQMLPKPSAGIPPAEIILDELPAKLLSKLNGWRGQNADRDCPLPQLYQLAFDGPAHLGAFHDALRVLHGRGKLALHPWTGPLYALPEPAFALLVGHEIAYYASVIGD